MNAERMPVLVGVGQVTEREPGAASSPLDLNETALLRAAEDAGLGRGALAGLGTLVVVKCFREPTRNSPQAIAQRIGAGNAAQYLMPDGGNGPQFLVNSYAEAIARGEAQFAAFCGAEAIATARRAIKATGKPPDWGEPADTDPALLVEPMDMGGEHDRAHGLWLASGFYAMCENARRHQQGKGIAEHQLDMGRLFARFTQVAAASPYAWYPVARSAEDIAWPSARNRFVAWPYTKYMNAMNQINQAAALLLTSVGQARRLGVAEDRWVYLHGCADTVEAPVGTRPSFAESPAMAAMLEEALGMSGLGQEELAHLDFYSCFPSAVQLARDYLGMAADDPRPLTVTGGLPFHGGAGNNYVMNSIAALCDKLRGDRGSYGMVTANGGYFSKHSAGIYSTRPTEGEWRRPPPAECQRRLDAAPQLPFTEKPQGKATVETWTVFYGRDGQPTSASIVGRLGTLDDPAAPRFYSVVEGSAAELEALTQRDLIGEQGTVAQDGEINKFSLG